jgi:hypothetical protein
MKVPLVYPKMTDSKNCPLKQFYAYEKLDGTNIHWCWNQNDHWYAFGTRRDRFPLTEDGIREFNKAHPGLEDVAQSFLDCGSHLPMAKTLDDFFFGRYGRHFTKISKVLYKPSEIIVFTEFRGAKSFAGQHEKDDHKDHYLIDVQVDGRFVSPVQLEYDFEAFREFLPRLIHKGKFSGDFVERVRKGKYHLDEGVVCKGMVDGELYMCKIKTDAYLKKLKEEFKDKWKDYWE